MSFGGIYFAEYADTGTAPAFSEGPALPVAERDYAVVHYGKPYYAVSVPFEEDDELAAILTGSWETFHG